MTVAPRASLGAAVDGARIAASAVEPNDWISHGRGYDETRFSPLTAIHDGNIGELGLAWYHGLDFNRGQESTPMVVDGAMFLTGAWSLVYALDAATGKLLWKHDPQVPRATAARACCDVVNRGVALWKGRVYVGTLDGRLQALDAATGELLWSVLTVDPGQPYTITGAPRVVKGKVIIGNGGGEFGVRGYVSAYDAESGSQLWRFYTVPGNPAQPFESKALEAAAKTWTGDVWWKYGGGGTVWDSMAYDPELDLLYIGVGNGSPWNQKFRSPQGGDNLFLSSIVALRPDTGEYVWHYQTTPGETWDYTATQHMILADLEIGGASRKVLMQAPKNGFFYVLDRATGEFISAEPYVQVTWASKIDAATGRPVETANARYSAGPQLVVPAPHGAHNWQPMSYSPRTGLVYVPAQEVPLIYSDDAQFEYRAGRWNTGVDMQRAEIPPGSETKSAILEMVKGYLIAWDPVQQQARWRHEHAGAGNGGVLSTAGNLVFQGDALGNFVAYRATDGEALWRAPAGSGIVAPPISYAVGNDQYVTVLAGWGGAYALAVGEVARVEARIGNVSRVLTFKLGGKASLPAPSPMAARRPHPPEGQASAAQVALGKARYYQYCMVCHGESAVSGSTIPDLRYMDEDSHTAFAGIVMGARENLGMPAFAQHLSIDEIEAIHAYVNQQARAESARLSAGS